MKTFAHEHGLYRMWLRISLLTLLILVINSAAPALTSQTMAAHRSPNSHRFIFQEIQ